MFLTTVSLPGTYQGQQLPGLFYSHNHQLQLLYPYLELIKVNNSQDYSTLTTTNYNYYILTWNLSRSTTPRTILPSQPPTTTTA